VIIADKSHKASKVSWDSDQKNIEDTIARKKQGKAFKASRQSF
jgi:hypothetical protein